MALSPATSEHPFGVWGRVREKPQPKPPVNAIAKEGFLFKKGGIIKSWCRRYCVLNRESLCYFRHEFNTAQDGQDGAAIQPLGRIFLSDVVNIQSDGVEKRKAFVFALHTKKRAVLFQAANTEDREKWVEAIQHTMDSDKEAERKDPFRRTLRKLSPGLKRITLIKDPDKGIGCTIKNAAGHILVHRIIEDGPIAHTGVLRPGDEILDIHGSAVSGLTVAEVVAIIKEAPDEFLATVKPLTAIKKGVKADTTPIIYSTIVPQAAPPTSSERGGGAGGRGAHQLGGSNEPPLTSSGASTTETSSSNGSLDDVGNYDDEDEGDIAPPLPPRTEDAFILVDPPPLAGPPSRPPKPVGLKELIGFQENHTHSKPRPNAGAALKVERPKIVKARSLEDNATSEQHSPQPRRRPHLYEDIDPPPSRRQQQRRPHFYEDVGPAPQHPHHPHLAKGGGGRVVEEHTYEEITPKPKLIYAELSPQLGAKPK